MLTTTSLSLPEGDMTVTASWATATGYVRAINEDSFLAGPPLFAVADGMGGHARGDAASRAAVDALRGLAPAGELPTPAEVVDTISAANDSVLGVAPGEGVISGTTLAGVALVRDGDALPLWMAFNIGDSRVYRWDGRHLVQLSVDHSAVQELVDAGLITATEAREHPDRNVITRAMGARNDVDADVWLLPVGRDQTFVICSDGLTKELDDHEIAATMSRFVATEQLPSPADALVAEALLAGGRDNVTVVIVEAAFDSTADSGDDSTWDRSERSAVLEDTTPRS